VAVVDARRCVACHREHRPRLTRAMGVTIADDHCFYCHADIADERPSHRGFAAEGCASAGCHNYHDNRALYEDFLVKHLDEPETLPQALLPRRNWASVERQIKKQPVRPLTLANRDAPQGLTVHTRVSQRTGPTPPMRAAGSTAPAATRPSPAKPRSACGGMARMKPLAASVT
jgi:hypothetical protein